MSLIGVVGCGKQAEKHASALREAGADLVFADLDADLATALAARFEGTAVASPTELLEIDGLGGVDICTPTPSHLQWCLATIDKGLPFFVEKPLCQTVDEARQIADAAAARHVIGGVGYIYRFVPSIEETRRLVQMGALGDITSATFRIGGRGNHQVWKHMRALGGGAISEMMVHMVDLAIWHFGPVREIEVVRCDQLLPVRSIGGNDVAVDTEDRVIAMMQCDTGPEIMISADMTSGSFQQWVDIQGTNGSAFASIDSSVNPRIQLTAAHGGYEDGRTLLEPTGNLHAQQMKEFTAVVAGERQTMRNTLADSVVLMDAMDQLRKAVDHA